MLRNMLYRPFFPDEKVEKGWGVEIIDGDFKGVVLIVQNIEFKESDNEDGNLILEYNIVSSPQEFEDGSLENNPLFQSTMDIIINDILKEAMQIHEQSTRDVDSNQSDS